MLWACLKQKTDKTSKWLELIKQKVLTMLKPKPKMIAVLK